MNIIKISMLVRSSDVVWSYKKAHECDFWEDVLSNLKASFPGLPPLRKENGTFHHIFYILTAETLDGVKAPVTNIIEKLLPEKAQRDKVVVSFAIPASEEVESILEPASSAEKEIIRDSLAPSSASDILKSLLEPSVLEESNDEADKPSNDGQTKEPSEGEKAPAAMTLSQRAEKIKKLKAGLLEKINGQRHAVDEVVQSIFECEMFSSHDEKRKGPLATFLFTGPSGVGKTFLAEQCENLLNRKLQVLDMSEYSDYFAGNKFNGDQGNPAIVTEFARKYPNGILLFDEIEKAHMNTIHLFLQILDNGSMMDYKVGREVSFKKNIIIMTTNAGRQLYEDSTVCDLSSTPRSVILDALRTDTRPGTDIPYFPECITTRMANGHVILFNHLEPYALLEIVEKEVKHQISLFEKSSGITVDYDPKLLSAIILYHGGGVSDARTLRGLTKNILVRELQEIVLQLYNNRAGKADSVNKISICVDTDGNEEISNLFVNHSTMYVSVFTGADGSSFNCDSNTVFDVTDDGDAFKRKIRGAADYILLDPLCGASKGERIPNDVEDITSEGMRMFDYVREFSPEIPVYILDTEPEENRSFETLLARGAKGVIKFTPNDTDAFEKQLDELSFSALINNAVFSLGRSGKFLSFNCAQYIDDTDCAIISFEKFQIKNAHLAKDSSMIARKGENNNLKFSGIAGCKAAKKTLMEYCEALDNPRKMLISGKRMPKGVLLYGPPGTGKTMLAKAMANECNATFFPISATTFFNKYVGETERNIREMFRKARKYAPAVIFIDEVDAIGRLRTGGSSSVHSENALNAFLAEMDGFVTDEKRPVFILAATNYDIEGDSGRILDPAFVRRFDSKIHIPLPDTDDRYELIVACLKKHGIHFGKDHDKIVRNMAERTGGMNNADLEMMHAQYVRILGDDEPDSDKYMDTLDAFRFGEVNKMDPEHLRQTAYHEAGHALVCKLCGTTPSFLTVVSRGNFGGFMESASERDHGSYTFDELMNRVCRSLAGRVAEIEVYGEALGTNTGASSDIKNARNLIRACLEDFAMGERLFVHWTAKEAEELIRKQYERTVQMIREHRGTLDRLTDLLAEKKSLDKTQLEEFFASENI